ncbi:MAG: alcohol dehydrogenase catalytic domain-containing protein [Balneolaceae bacterium]|nr:alcohol dehydrogenase catalytic domain-containing protein [Balneolaceae bacterium]
MKSLQLAEFGKPLQWAETETPVPKGKEVLLKVDACGVCHSDLHIWEGYYELGNDERMYIAERGVDLPLTLGHEVVGTVVQAGEDVTEVKKGDRRLIYPWVGCGECKYCRTDRMHMCLSPGSIGVFQDGGYSDYILIPHEQYLVDIDGLKPENACSYACAGLTAYSALKKMMPLEDDETMVIVGAGGLGLMAMQVVRELTSAKVIVIDVDNEKLKAAGELGNFTTINSKSENPVDRVMELTDGKGASAIVDFVNNQATSTAAFNMLQKNGIMVMVGLFGGKLTFSNPVATLKNLTIRGSYTGGLSELRELIDIVRDKKLKSIPVKTYKLDAADELLKKVKNGEITGRAVVAP